jgi:hypothetical protein
MIGGLFGALAARLAPYGTALAAGVAVLALAIAGVQSARVAWISADRAELRRDLAVQTEALAHARQAAAVLRAHNARLSAEAAAAESLRESILEEFSDETDLDPAIARALRGLRSR